MQFRTHKIIYRRYAGLFFSLCVDITDNELAYLECIHLFVEILDHFFSNVCELDLVFNFHKVCHLSCVFLPNCLQSVHTPFSSAFCTMSIDASVKYLTLLYIYFLKWWNGVSRHKKLSGKKTESTIRRSVYQITVLCMWKCYLKWCFLSGKRKKKSAFCV